MIDFFPSILENSSKCFSLFASESINASPNIVPPSTEYPTGVDGYKFDSSVRVPVNPTGYMKANNLYIFSNWKISHNLPNENLDYYAIDSSSSWILWNAGVPWLDSSIPFSDTQENNLFFILKPTCDNPNLEVSFAGLYDSSNSDFLNIRKMRIGLRFTVYEVSDRTIVNEWLGRRNA